MSYMATRGFLLSTEIAEVQFYFLQVIKKGIGGGFHQQDNALFSFNLMDLQSEEGLLIFNH